MVAMAEELQGLLDRIRKEGLDKAETEAKSILDEARRKASEIVKTAESEAARHKSDAEAEAARMQQRSIHAIEQAARDVILSVGDALQQAFTDLVKKDTSKALDDAKLAPLVAEVMQAYSKQDQNARIDVLLSPKQQEQVSQYFLKHFTEAMRKGVEVKSSRGIISGFSLVLRNQGVEHDFTGETISAAFMELLRPQLGEIVKKAIGTIQKTA
jgi:V/A-type H+/Na+-transporting ATPase subunit E